MNVGMQSRISFGEKNRPRPMQSVSMRNGAKLIFSLPEGTGREQRAEPLVLPTLQVPSADKRPLFLYGSQGLIPVQQIQDK